MRRALAGLLALCAGVLAPDGAGAPEAATRLYVSSHINSNQVQGLASWGGRLILATTGGVSTLDLLANQFVKTLRSPGGLPSNDILCAEVSPSGSLWAGTADAGIARMRPDGTFRRTITSYDGLPSDRVQAMYVRGDTIWVGTSGGAALLVENPATAQLVLTRTFTKASTAGALVGDDVRAFLLAGDTVWCATTSGLSSFAAGVWTPRTVALSLTATSLALHSDTVWAATNLGPYRYEDGIFRAANSGHAFASRVLHERSGVLYSGAAFAGVHRYQSGAWVSQNTGIVSPQIGAMRDGPDGSLWAGTLAGLARYDSTSASWETHLSDGPLVSAVKRGIVDSRGVWFATGNAFPPGGPRGLVLHYDGQWSVLSSGSTGGSFQNADAFGLLSDRTDRLWIGHCCADGDPRPRVDLWDRGADAWSSLSAYNIWALDQAPSSLVYGAGVELESGLYALDSQTGALIDSLTPANTSGGLSSNGLRAIRFDSAGKGWIGTAARGLDVWDGGGTLDHADDVWTHYNVSPSNEVTSIAVLGPEAAWIGTTSGAGRIENGIFTRVLTTSGNPGLPSGQVNDLTLDFRGNLWIATGGGLVRADASGGGKLEVFTTQEGLISNDVQAVAWDQAQGALWVGTGAGISRAVPVTDGDPGFTEATYVFPNPVSAPGGELRIGGIRNALQGEIRDLAGNIIHRFHCDPVSDRIWNLSDSGGGPAAPGVYLVVLRDKDRTKVLRAAVIR